jgi:hypothetical protein
MTQKCINCQQEIEDRVPELDSAIEEERIRNEYRRGATSSSIFTSVGSSVAASRTRAQTQSTFGPGIYQDDRESAWGGATRSGRSPSPTDFEFSTARLPSSYARSGSNNFADISAYAPTVQTRVAKQMDREARNQRQADMTRVADEECDSDDGEDPY